MTIEDMIKEVSAIRDSMTSILMDSSTAVLSEALAQLHAQKDKAAKLKRNQVKPPWTLVIKPQKPLAFQNTENEDLVKHKLEVDLCCSLSEPDGKGEPKGEHNLAVRIWCTDKSILFREALDAESLRTRIETQGRRVMLRFHFDHANQDQQGPKHHLQIGGKGLATDYHWLPDNWKLPRFVHAPINLALACEFIARTFYPNKFARISQEPTWTHAVKTAEQTYLFPFLKRLPYVTIDPKLHTTSLLSSVWNG